METIIQVRGLTKAYGQLPAVDHVSLSVKAGTVFGLLGANGAGKSTTIECILGTKKADSGEISILSLNPQKDRRRLFQKVGVQFQECDYQQKLKCRSYAKKPFVCIRTRLTGKSCVHSSDLRTKQIQQSKVYLVENVNGFLSYLP